MYSKTLTGKVTPGLEYRTLDHSNDILISFSVHLEDSNNLKHYILNFGIPKNTRLQNNLEF